MSTKAKIEKLTAAQEIRLKEWRAEWFAIGCATEPTDKSRAEAAIVAMYARVGKSAPHFIHVDSPATAWLAMVVLKKLGDQKTGASLGDSLGASLGDSRYRYFSGQQEAYWVAFYAFSRDVLGVEYARSKDLDLWVEVSKSCGWFWPFEGLCIVANRPEVVKWEPGRAPERLHCVDGPALRFRDGWAVHALRGVRVPGELIDDPAKLTASRIDAEANAEVRRVLVEQYGLAKYILDSGAVVVDEDVEFNGQPRRLLRKPASGGAPDLLMVECRNATPEPDGTRKTYFLHVEPTLRPMRRRADGTCEVFGEAQAPTCHNAVASTFGRRGECYGPVVQT